LGFSVVLYRPKGLILDRVTGKVVGRENTSTSVNLSFTEAFTEGENKLLRLIADGRHVTTSEMADALGVSRQTISKRLKALKEKHAIERIGSDTKGSWIVIP
jgi:predicted HTH transcriptional regulator